jgi:hypothetical protein
MFISPMSALKRIRITDSSRASRRVRRVPICDIERERRGLVEGHADPLLLAPDNVTGNVRAVRLKDKVKTLGNVVGSAASSAAPEMVMLRTKQLIAPPAN